MAVAVFEEYLKRKRAEQAKEVAKFLEEEDMTLMDKLCNRRKLPNTPDFIDIKQEDQIPVFVYGTVQRGGIFHNYVNGCKYLGKAYTNLDRYQMKEIGTGDFPVAFQADKGTKVTQMGRLSGEVYVVDPLSLVDIDVIENNGTMYQRKKVWVVLKDQIYGGAEKKSHPSIQAWVYFGMNEFWKDRTLYLSPYEIRGQNNHFFWDATKKRVKCS